MAAKKKAVKGKSKSPKSTSKGPVNLEEVRERLRRVIAGKAEAMTSASIEEASKGNLSPLKYLFEVLGLYPATAAEGAEPAEGNDLARVLLKRFNFPFEGPADEEPGEASKEAPVGTPVVNDSVE
jgi:hypothetical protein